MVEAWLIAPVMAVISILAGFYIHGFVKKQDTGTDKMRFVAGAIKQGARTFLNRMYKTLAYFIVGMALVLLVFLPTPIWATTNIMDNVILAFGYVFGAVCSGIAGWMGMDVATDANIRAASAARQGISKSFPIAFRGGAVMGTSVIGLALLGVSSIYFLTGDPNVILGFSFGASALALFAKAGGGIFTKTADIGADLVGKVEFNLDEDDPRNPAVIADNVGDNVGDVAGMGADLFDSYVASLMAVMILGTVLGGYLIEMPLVYAGLGAIASLIGIFAVNVKEGQEPGAILNRGTYITVGLFLVLSYAANIMLGYNLRFWGASAVGLIAGVVIGFTGDYYTSIDQKPAMTTAEASQTGAAVNIITGFSYGLLSTFPPMVGVGLAAWLSYAICAPLGNGYGVYGIAISAFGMLSIVGIVVANDSFGPIGDNAKGIAEQGGLDDETIRILDKMDAAGNTSKAITKGFAIGAAGLTVISILATFKEVAEFTLGTEVIFDLMNPLVMLGALIGCAIPAVFSAQLMLGVGRNAERMIIEIRRQFAEIPGLIEGEEGVVPEYEKCIDIATTGALQELVPATLTAIGVTLIVGFVFGIEALGGYLAGCIFSGLILALLMSNAGGLWDNAKKYVEDGNLGGKGSPAHHAAIIGDTVGDPFKDTAGPSINTLITVIGLVANVFLPLFLMYALL